MKLDGKTALVTGGAVRIGRAICEALADRGCNLVIHYHHSGNEAKKFAAQLKAKGLKTFLVSGNLSSDSGCRAVISAAVKKAGRLDVLINNAAVFHKDGLMSVTSGKFMREMEINFLAPMLLTREFSQRIMKETKREKKDVSGKVVNLLDRRITGSESDCLPYLLSKKMLAEFTKSSALQLAPYITVNGVAPGAILAPPRHAGTGSRTRDFAGNIPLGRKCTPGDVADAVVFLLESDGITGQVVFVDGGQHLLGNVQND